jgi:hypothetical protein
MLQLPFEYLIRFPEVKWRAALAIIAELRRAKRLLIGVRKQFAAISASLEHGLDELFVFPGEAANENCDLIALLSVERSFDWPPVVGVSYLSAQIP